MHNFERFGENYRYSCKIFLIVLQRYVYNFTHKNILRKKLQILCKK
jgi:hypothetical protein